MIEIPSKLRLRRYSPEMAHVESSPVEPEDYGQLPALREYLLEAMRKYNGAGMAACQAGIFSNYCVVGLEGGGFLDFVNPEIVEMRGYEPYGFEACLSIPPVGNGALVARMERITVVAGSADEPDNRKAHRLQAMDARVAQHEIDHLVGVFFIDRIGEKARQAVLKRYQIWKDNREEPSHAKDFAGSFAAFGPGAHLPHMRKSAGVGNNQRAQRG